MPRNTYFATVCVTLMTSFFTVGCCKFKPYHVQYRDDIVRNAVQVKAAAEETPPMERRTQMLQSSLDAFSNQIVLGKTFKEEDSINIAKDLKEVNRWTGEIIVLTTQTGGELNDYNFITNLVASIGDQAKSCTDTMDECLKRQSRNIDLIHSIVKLATAVLKVIPISTASEGSAAYLMLEPSTIAGDMDISSLHVRYLESLMTYQKLYHWLNLANASLKTFESITLKGGASAKDFTHLLLEIANKSGLSKPHEVELATIVANLMGDFMARYTLNLPEGSKHVAESLTFRVIKAIISGATEGLQLSEQRLNQNFQMHLVTLVN